MTSGFSTRMFTSKSFPAIAAGIFSLYMFGWTTRWTFDPTQQAGFSDWFFTAQADAILRGRLWVDLAANSPGAWTADGNECFWIDGHCYGYWGLTPSLLRIPLVLFFANPTASLANVMIPIAGGIAMFAALDLCRQRSVNLAPERSGVFMAVAAVALGPGSVLVLLADPFVYQEAIIWSVAFVMIAVNLFWRWWHGGPNGFLVGTALACVLAAGARPTTVLIGPVLAAAIVFRLRTKIISNHRLLASVAALMLTPALFSFGTMYAKFDRFSQPSEAYQNPTGSKYQNPLNAVDNRYCLAPVNRVSIENVPTNLFAYLRPDSARVFMNGTPVRFRFRGCAGNAPTLLWPRDTFVGYYVERHTSVTTTMPLATLATAIVGVSTLRRRRWLNVSVLTALASSLSGMLTVPVLTARYLGDFYPLVAVGLALSCPDWVSATGRRARPWLLGIGAASLVWSVVTVASLLTLYGWIYGLL